MPEAMKLSWAIALLAVIHGTPAFAVGILKLSSSEITVSAEQASSALWIHNAGDTPLYLDVRQQLVENPGQSPESLTDVDEVSEPSLLVIPRRLVLAPEQRYRITMRVLAVPRERKVWRITFRPREKLIASVGGASDIAPVSLSIGYGIVVYQAAARPARP